MREILIEICDKIFPFLVFSSYIVKFQCNKLLFYIRLFVIFSLYIFFIFFFFLVFLTLHIMR